jgi:predicted outer membrane protein
MKGKCILAGALTLFVAAWASAQVPTEGRHLVGTTRTELPGSNQNEAIAARAAVNDALFAAAAADNGLVQVVLSRLGQQRATDPELKRFSERMTEEHSRMNVELRSLAIQKGYTLPQTIDYRSQFCVQSLAGLSGADFDRSYARAQLVLHLESVAVFEAEAQRGADRDMTAFASKALSRINEHLKTIKPIARKYMAEEESEHAQQGTTRPTVSR